MLILDPILLGGRSLLFVLPALRSVLELVVLDHVVLDCGDNRMR